jgi:VWFA-related protein
MNVLLIDRMNTPLNAQAHLRLQVIDYLKKIRPGTRIAIFSLTDHLAMLQGFTGDPTKLLAILEKHANPKASAMSDDPMGNGGPEKTSDMIGDLNSPAYENTNLAGFIAFMQVTEKTVSSFQQLDRGARTLEALNSLGRYLSGIPGRKNVLWFSGSFPLELLPQVEDNVSTEFMNVGDNQAEYRETVNLLSQGQIAIYPIDARGLAPLATNVNVASGDDSKYFSGKNAGEVRAKELDTDMEQVFEEQTMMRDLARQTGGRSFMNTNDLTGDIATAIDDGSSYYTFTYTPTDTSMDGKFRRIEIRLRAGKYNLSYRQGYYADDSKKMPSGGQWQADGRIATAPTPPSTSANAMRVALMHGGPTPTQIVFTARVQPAGSTTEQTLVPGNEGTADMKAPYRRFSINLTSDPRGITFTTDTDGTRHGNLEFVSFLYNSDGKLINLQGSPLRPDYTAAQYEGILQHGIAYHQEISVPEKGEYFLRIATHDIQGNHVGAVELPISAVRTLPPGTGAATPASR